LLLTYYFFVDSKQFVQAQNQVGYLGEVPPKHRALFQPLVTGLANSKLWFAITENTTIRADLIREFWDSATLTRNETKMIRLKGQVKGIEVLVNEDVVRECLKLGDISTALVKFGNKLVSEVLLQMGYEGKYPRLQKKLLHPYWKFLAHIFMSVFYGKAGGYDILDEELTSGMIALAKGYDFNYSSMIMGQIAAFMSGRIKKAFYAFPRFIQLIIDQKYPQIISEGVEFKADVMTPRIFGQMLMNKKSVKDMYTGKVPA
jgi:hypothetical protein